LPALRPRFRQHEIVSPGASTALTRLADGGTSGPRRPRIVLTTVNALVHAQ